MRIIDHQTRQPVSRENFIPALRLGWTGLAKQKIIHYNPSRLATLRLGPYEVFSLPQRAARKKHQLNPPVDRPHQSDGCIFDSPTVIDRDTLFDVHKDQTLYHLMPNIFPLLPGHLLLVRANAGEVNLSQHIASPADLFHLLLLQNYLTPDQDILFSSNPGKLSDAGASQNHWHAHIFPFARPVRNLPLSQVISQLAGARAGKLDWPAQLRVFEGNNRQELSYLGFRYIDILNHRNKAYNLAVIKGENDLARLLVIPRGPRKPRTRQDGLRAVWAGNPHCGTIFEVSLPNFRAMSADPATAERTITAQLKETTLSDEEMAPLDKIFLAK